MLFFVLLDIKSEAWYEGFRQHLGGNHERFERKILV